VEDRSILGLSAPEPSAELYLPAGERVGRVALVHGGFWRPAYDRVHLRPMAAALRDAGWEVVSVEYRRVPGDPDVTVSDVRETLEAVKPDVVAGHSAGGHLALWAAATIGLKAVALAPVADLRMAEELNLDGGAVKAFLGAAAEERADLDPARLGDPGAVLIHGEQDSLVPIGLSRSYAAARPASRLVELPGTAHFELIDPRADAWPVVIQELQRLLA
jgi:acetyl esterase/lipase